MMFVSLTRLRIRSVRFLPLFFLHVVGTMRQVKKAQGFQTGAVLNDRQWTFWTMTAWDTQANMRQFMNSGAHKKVMPRLLNWCDEASVAHWQQEESVLPSWAAAAKRMRTEGRPSKVRFPSPHHATLDFREPRTAAMVPIRPD
jgi:hypothetical protein